MILSLGNSPTQYLIVVSVAILVLFQFWFAYRLFKRSRATETKLDETSKKVTDVIVQRAVERLKNSGLDWTDDFEKTRCAADSTKTRVFNRRKYDT